MFLNTISIFSQNAKKKKLSSQNLMMEYTETTKILKIIILEHVKC
jgi:hypothetical protein